MEIHTIGIFWYKKDQYDEFMNLFDDRAKLHDTYAAWIKDAESGFNSLSAKGRSVIKIEADIDEFKSWCARNSHRFDSKGRNAFVNYKVAVSLGLVKK